VSSGTGLNPIESGTIKVPVDSAGVTLWQLAPDNSGQAGTPQDWGEPLDFLTKIGATNTIFWAKARVASTEEPANDTSVDIQVAATIGATS